MSNQKGKQMSEETQEHNDHPNRKKIIIFTAVCFALLGVIVFLYWATILRYREYTDDAYVNGNMVELTSQVNGIVVSINADNTDYVTENQVIIELDRTDNELLFNQSKAELAQTVRQVVQMFLQVEELEAELEGKNAQLEKAEQDFANRVNLVPFGGVSREEFEHIEANLRSAIASAKETYHSLQAAIVEVQNTTVKTHPLVDEAKQKVKDTYLNLQRCSIVSPVNGYIAKRSAQLGEWVNQAEPLLAIIPIDEIWVDANFKEVKLADMRIGQSAKVISDIYGRKVDFKGKVVGIGAGTGSVFSALPPQNATGNWIKIVQRVPVRISIDKEVLKKYPLFLGLSMEVTVDIHNTSGQPFATIARDRPIYQTKIYSEQEKGIDPIIEQIIEENIADASK